MSTNVIYPRGFQFGGGVLAACICGNYSSSKSLLQPTGVGCNSKVQNLNDSLLRFILYYEQIIVWSCTLTITPVMMKLLFMPQEGLYLSLSLAACSVVVVVVVRIAESFMLLLQMWTLYFWSSGLAQWVQGYRSKQVLTGVGEHDRKEFEKKICLQPFVVLHSGLFIQDKKLKYLMPNSTDIPF